MKSTSLFFEYEGVKMHYLRYEGGPKALVCFHGYGQNAGYYKRLSERLSKRYTLYAIDLFHHGKSIWPRCEKPIYEKFFAELMEAFFIHNQIKTFSLCGYSLGGKLVLCLAERLYERLENILLIAPDGIKTNFWYSMATYPYWMRMLFRYSVKKPGLYFRVSSLLYQLKLVDKGVIRFARKQMDTESKRRKVYCTWLTYRRIRPDTEMLAKHINGTKIRIFLFLGKYDKIISQRSIKPLISKLDHYELIILDKGHNTLIDDVAMHEQNVL